MSNVFWTELPKFIKGLLTIPTKAEKADGNREKSLVISRFLWYDEKEFYDKKEFSEIQNICGKAVRS